MLKQYFSRVILAGCVSCLVVVSHAYASVPLATDSRIRTVIYNENEVFRLTTDYGYQSNIVFSEGERIRTVSIGDPVPFRVTPSENRLFIKAQQRSHLTNMTVVTNERVYHFELSSRVKSPKDVIYVMRFFYPENDIDSLYAGEIREQHDVEVSEFAPVITLPPVVQSPPVVDVTVAQNPVVPQAALQVVPPVVDVSVPTDVGVGGQVASLGGAEQPVDYNYIYSISGPTGPYDYSPTKIFDDGSQTFLKFSPADIAVVRMFEVLPDGSEVPLVSEVDGEYLVVQGVPDKMAARIGSDVLCVYNDANLQ